MRWAALVVVVACGDNASPPFAYRVPIAEPVVVDALALIPGEQGVVVSGTRSGDDHPILRIEPGRAQVVASRAVRVAQLYVVGDTIFGLEDPDANDVVTVPLGGGAPSISLLAQGGPDALDVDETSIYFTGGPNGEVVRTNLDGSQPLVFPSAFAITLASDDRWLAGAICFPEQPVVVIDKQTAAVVSTRSLTDITGCATESAVSDGRLVMHLELNTLSPTLVLYDLSSWTRYPDAQGQWPALDADSLYYSDDAGAIWQRPVVGGSPTMIAQADAGLLISGFRIDANRIVFVESDSITSPSTQVVVSQPRS